MGEVPLYYDLAIAASVLGESLPYERGTPLSLSSRETCTRLPLLVPSILNT